ncbi:MAG: TIGR03960 family B12-binding radical SAM protein [Lachnospiraceae bacterium]|nr:TIGR03960 family B12-binding radical SAM protein [Lachnospiraceae bacterium]
MNDNLALSDDILMSVEKPARYIGNEVNAVYKDPDKVDIRFVMCFPDVYEIGMSHLGIQILYDMFNKFEDTWCERVYSPWPDLDAIMRKEKLPLFALESQQPIKDFDFLGITLQYEMCYTNILQILDLAGIPLYSSERTWDDPIVFGGGPCSYNPEPVAEFFDIFYIGEGETRYREFLDLYKKLKGTGISRNDFLIEASKIPGMYVPSLYEIKYNDDFTIRSIEPMHPSVPRKITKEVVKDLNDTFFPTAPVVPYLKSYSDRINLEIQRGCIRGCRFCQAGQVYRPVRERSIDFLLDTAVSSLKNTGFDEITLSSLSSSDYSKLDELIEGLIKYCDENNINISLPSLRIDAFSLDIMSKIQDVKKSSLTFAPEAGSQRLRDIINKNLTVQNILNGCEQAFIGGWNKVKLYFMLGLPFENDEDINGIANLANDIAALYYETVPKEKRMGRAQITVSTSFFVPKPFTPFQWASQDRKEDFIDKAYRTRKAISGVLNQKSIKYNWHETDTSVLEGVFARGDRRLSKVILNAYKKGCIFDAWSEYYKNDLWLEAFEECGISMDHYTTRERPDDEIFPWDMLDCGVSKEFLLREWHKAKEGVPSPNCKEKCNGCGAASFGVGICRTHKQ